MHHAYESRKRLAIFGLGDLGKRIAFGISAANADVTLLLASRNRDYGEETAALMSACSGRAVTHYAVDGTDYHSTIRFLMAARPEILVQCASIVSPWSAFERSGPALDAFRAAGFAANLSAQLPVISNVMRAMDESRTDCVVVNCSYPDVTNPVLATMGIAPQIGVGNVGMLRRLIAVQFNYDKLDLKVFAHHAQIWPFLKGGNDYMTSPVRVFFGDREMTERVCASKSRVPANRDLNALAAAHALEVLEGLLNEDCAAFTSAPGPLGLPGGWPVQIFNRDILLDMPAGLSVEAMIAYQQKAGALEGIQEIARDGTVHFTERLISMLPDGYKALGAPLRPDQALERSRLLVALLGGP